MFIWQVKKKNSKSGKIFFQYKLAQASWFEEELISLSNGLDKKGTTKKIEKLWELIGRLEEKYRLVSGKYTIEVDATNQRGIGYLSGYLYKIQLTNLF
ncbi:MAG: hypothetical protein GY790_16715 [Bacteroidetes bacterium]|nr:hypothetical protein [Bacteroidota bacterium]